MTAVNEISQTSENSTVQQSDVGSLAVKSLEKLAQLCSENSVDALEMIEDLKNFPAFAMLMKNKDMKNMYDSITSSFFFSNGLFNRLDFKVLNDEQKTFYALINLAEYQPMNRYRQHILNYYFTNLDKPIYELNLNNGDWVKDSSDLNVIKNYYSNVPCLTIGLNKIIVANPQKEFQKLTNPNSDIFKFTPLFVKVGESMQFDIEGFPKNQFLYLLFGMCILSVYNSKHETFKQLIKHIQSFIQLNLFNKVFDSDIVKGDEPYSLVTFLDFAEDGNGIRHNFRYQCSKNYIDMSSQTNLTTTTSTTQQTNHLTKLTKDEKGVYLHTEYKTTQEINEIWKRFEELYAKQQYDDLIKLWFDSQILTRSTCLVGCMLLSILKGKLIKFKKDEMPDWKTIISGTFEGTFEIVGDLPKMNLDLRLIDVLSCFKVYCSKVTQ